MRYLLLLISLFGCLPENPGRLKQSETLYTNKDKWTPLIKDTDLSGLYRYDDKDVSCYVYETSRGNSMQCFKK